jgi:hypothetical protein
MAGPGQPKTGGRQKGTTNKSTANRQAQMQLVNEALIAVGEDPLTGMKLLRAVLNDPNTPLDIRVDVAGMLLKHELPTAEDHRYVTVMPPVMPGESAQQQLAVWRALYDRRDDDDPEWIEACNRVLELAANRKRPETMQ